MSWCKTYVAKHSDAILDVILLAGTKVFQIKTLAMKIWLMILIVHWLTLHNIEMSKTFPSARFLLVLTWLHNINNKVSEFNSLLSERFSDTEEHISVADTIPPEFRCYYVDGLHFGHFGLKKVCSIILSNLYKLLAPSKHKNCKS